MRFCRFRTLRWLRWIVLALCIVAAVLPLGRRYVALSAQIGCANAKPPWNGQCFYPFVPKSILHTAPFAIVDPTREVRAVTGLTLSRVYAAWLGSNDPDQSHPRGPLMMVDYEFGDATSTGARHVSVWEDGFWLSEGGPRLAHGNGIWSLQTYLERRRMEFHVTSSISLASVVTLTHWVKHAVLAQSVRPPPSLRLYVQQPTTPPRSGDTLHFLVLSNEGAARVGAVYHLALDGSWGGPQILSPYEGQACGGDNVPTFSILPNGEWNLEFGDCPEIDLALRPFKQGHHAFTITVFRVPFGPNGRPDYARETLVPNATYRWVGDVGS